MEVIEVKIIVMVILGCVSFMIGLASLKLWKLFGLKTGELKKGQEVATSFLLCLGAGVLLATSMLHILPEMRHGLEEFSEKLEIEWLAEVIVCAGFFLVYLVEELVHFTLSSTKHSETLHRTLSVRISKPNTNSKPRDSVCNSEDTTVSSSNGSIVEEGTSTNTKDDKMKENRRLSHSSGGHGHSHLLPNSGSSNLLRDFLTVLALSFHAVFEGLAVGVEEHVADIWTLFAAIATHKFVITFSMSLELLQNKTKMKLFLIYLATWSFVSPLGIGIGMIITELSQGSSENQELVVGIFQGLACGTIIYVVMFEILQREKSRDVSGLLQLVGVLAGFGLMMVVEIFLKHEHEHEHEEHQGHHEFFGEAFTNMTLEHHDDHKGHFDHDGHDDHAHHDHDHHIFMDTVKEEMMKNETSGNFYDPHN